MEVYLVYSQYYDGCDSWDELVDIFSTPEKAEKEIEKLEKKKKNLNYFVRVKEVK